MLALDSPQHLIEQLGDVSTVVITMLLSEEQIRTVKEQPFVHSLSYDEGLVILQTSEPQSVQTLLDELGSADGQHPRDITIRKTNLEDVFLSLTGRALVAEETTVK
jgi:hypothetical protein